MSKHIFARRFALPRSEHTLAYCAMTLLLSVMLVPVLVAPVIALIDRFMPLERTAAVTLKPSLIAQLRAAGVHDIKPLPVWSGARGVFAMHVNGEEPKTRSHSEVLRGSQMYRVVVTDTGAEVFVRKDGKETLSPAEYARFIEDDLSRHLARVAARQERVAQMSAWD